jgi:hypothetical protein
VVGVAAAMTPALTRRLVVVALCAACRGDDAPIEKLPAPPPPAWQQPFPHLPPPPPPPPPPRPSFVGPPDVLDAFLRVHTGCSVRIHRAGSEIRLSQLMVAELLARLDQWTAWSDGEYGCNGDPIELRIACAGPATLKLISDCGNVELGSDRAAFSEPMADWLYQALRTGTVR